MVRSKLTEIEALDLFEQAITKVGGKDKTLLAAIEFQDDFSLEAARIVGQIQTIILNTQDKYGEAIRSVCSWCDFAIPLMKAFLDIKEYESRQVITQCLVDGKKDFGNVIKSLGECQDYIAEVVGHLTVLRSQLKKDFDEKSDYYNTLIRNWQYGTYGAGIVGGAVPLATLELGIATTAGTLVAAEGVVTTATALAAEGAVVGSSFILGPFGLVLVCAGAAFVASKVALEVFVKPKLNEKLANIQSQFDDVQTKMENTNSLIASLKVILEKDLELTNQINSGQIVLNTLIDLPNLPEPNLTEQAKELIERCQEFIAKHRSIKAQQKQANEVQVQVVCTDKL